MRPQPDRNVLIIGAGVGGLSAARALQSAGISVTVLEEARTLQAVGGGLKIWLNGTSALQHLGLLEEALALGASGTTYEFWSWQGKQLVNIDVGEMAQSYGRPSHLWIRRSDLVRLLFNALHEGTIQFEKKVVGYHCEKAGVTAVLAGGEEIQGSALVGADGITSVVRQQVAPGIQPIYAGYQYVRAMIDQEWTDVPAGAFRFTFGRGNRFAIANLGHNCTYWFAVINVPEGTVYPRPGIKAELLGRFGSFAGLIPEVIAATPEKEIMNVDIRDIVPMKSWGEDSMTLLGDAAHAPTPNMGRGASEAIEDAVVLALTMSSIQDWEDQIQVVAALRQYETLRMEPTAHVQRQGRLLGRLASWKTPAACMVRDIAMEMVMNRRLRSTWRQEMMQPGLWSPVPEKVGASI